MTFKRPTWWSKATQDGRLFLDIHGIAWLVPKGDRYLSAYSRVLKVRFLRSASVIDMRDLSHPGVRAVKDKVSMLREPLLGHPLSDDAWLSWAGSNTLLRSGNEWVVPLLLESGVDGIVVDGRGNPAAPRFLALLNLSAVSSIEEVDHRAPPIP